MSSFTLILIYAFSAVSSLAAIISLYIVSFFTAFGNSPGTKFLKIAYSGFIIYHLSRIAFCVLDEWSVNQGMTEYQARLILVYFDLLSECGIRTAICGGAGFIISVWSILSDEHWLGNWMGSLSDYVSKPNVIRNLILIPLTMGVISGPIILVVHWGQPIRVTELSKLISSSYNGILGLIALPIALDLLKALKTSFHQSSNTSKSLFYGILRVFLPCLVLGCFALMGFLENIVTISEDLKLITNDLNPSDPVYSDSRVPYISPFELLFSFNGTVASIIALSKILKPKENSGFQKRNVTSLSGMTTIATTK